MDSPNDPVESLRQDCIILAARIQRTGNRTGCLAEARFGKDVQKLLAETSLIDLAREALQARNQLFLLLDERIDWPKNGPRSSLQELRGRLKALAGALIPGAPIHVREDAEWVVAQLSMGDDALLQLFTSNGVERAQPTFIVKSADALREGAHSAEGKELAEDAHRATRQFLPNASWALGALAVHERIREVQEAQQLEAHLGQSAPDLPLLAHLRRRLHFTIVAVVPEWERTSWRSVAQHILSKEIRS